MWVTRADRLSCAPPARVGTGKVFVTVDQVGVFGAQQARQLRNAERAHQHVTSLAPPAQKQNMRFNTRRTQSFHQTAIRLCHHHGAIARRVEIRHQLEQRTPGAQKAGTRGQVHNSTRFHKDS
jgi:CDP-diacylglycerol pyrophosphatase